jgi:hypothetical protein
VGSLSPRQGLQTATPGVALHTVAPAHKHHSLLITSLYFALARSLAQWHSRTQRTHAQPPSDFPNLQPLRLDQVTTTIVSEQQCPHQWPDHGTQHTAVPSSVARPRDATATADKSSQVKSSRNHTAPSQMLEASTQEWCNTPPSGDASHHHRRHALTNDHRWSSSHVSVNTHDCCCVCTADIQRGVVG